MEFGDKPEIYNEFLDIMKNFKVHTADPCMKQSILRTNLVSLLNRPSSHGAVYFFLIIFSLVV